MLTLNSTARRASISKFVENYVLSQVQFNAIEILKIAAETPRTFRSQDRSLFLNTFYEFRSDQIVIRSSVSKRDSCYVIHMARHV